MNKKLKNRIINQSRKLYDKNGDTYQHFSFLIDGNKIVSWGKNNKKKSHPFSARHGYTYFKIHSELAAIKEFPYSLSELEGLYSIVNVRLNKKLEIMLAAPCFQCIRMLDFFGIREIIYSNERGEFVKL